MMVENENQPPFKHLKRVFRSKASKTSQMEKFSVIFLSFLVHPFFQSTRMLTMVTGEESVRFPLDINYHSANRPNCEWTQINIRVLFFQLAFLKFFRTILRREDKLWYNLCATCWMLFLFSVKVSSYFSGWEKVSGNKKYVKWRAIYWRENSWVVGKKQSFTLSKSLAIKRDLFQNLSI